MRDEEERNGRVKERLKEGEGNEKRGSSRRRQRVNEKERRANESARETEGAGRRRTARTGRMCPSSEKEENNQEKRVNYECQPGRSKQEAAAFIQRNGERGQNTKAEANRVRPIRKVSENTKLSFEFK